jgi:hypothetical protein
MPAASDYCEKPLAAPRNRLETLAQKGFQPADSI